MLSSKVFDLTRACHLIVFLDYVHSCRSMFRCPNKWMQINSRWDVRMIRGRASFPRKGALVEHENSISIINFICYKRQKESAGRKGNENFPPPENIVKVEGKKVSNLSCVKKGKSRCCVALNFPTQWIPIRHLRKIRRQWRMNERTLSRPNLSGEHQKSLYHCTPRFCEYPQA